MNYKIKCDECGCEFDGNDMAMVFSHDLIDKNTGKYYCLTPEQTEGLRKDLPNRNAHKLGQPAEIINGIAYNIN